MNTQSIETRFLRFCEEYALFAHDSILVAFSGGADSSVLLSLMQNECAKRKIRLAALHINHGIRGEEALRDVAFCQAFCKGRNIPLHTVTIDVPMLAKQTKGGIEETARRERYRILNEYAKENDFSVIATAHNATDNLETLIFHLTRGMTLRGAGGIHPARGNLIRPLLPFTKNEIVSYAEENGIAYVCDSTNTNIAYTRNYIRHEILPHLYKINPHAEEAALRFAKTARIDDEALTRIAESYRTCNDVALLNSLDAAILSRVLLIKYRENANNELSEAHIHTLMSKLTEAANGRFSGRISLPGRVAVRFSNHTLQFLKDSRSSGEKSVPSEVLLPLDSGTAFANRYRICIGDTVASLTVPLDSADIPQKAIVGKLSVRARRPGDTYVSGKMTRKLKKLLCDYGIPTDERDAWPIICDEEGILFVPLLPKADRIKQQPNDAKDTVHIEIHSDNNLDSTVKGR